MLQNARVTAFTVFELLRENQQGKKNYFFCSAENCNENYIGESAQQLGEKLDVKKRPVKPKLFN